MSTTYNYTDMVLNALKFYSIGANDEGATARAALPLASEVTEQFANAIGIISNLMAKEEVLKKTITESNSRRCSERKIADEEIERLRKLCTKNKINHKKPARKKS